MAWTGGGIDMGELRAPARITANRIKDGMFESAEC